jgi:hypothetical protein
MLAGLAANDTGVGQRLYEPTSISMIYRRLMSEAADFMKLYGAELAGTFWSSAIRNPFSTGERCGPDSGRQNT